MLEKKARQLTGAADSAAPPAGRNVYGWHIAEGRADIFLTYCTNAVIAAQENPGQQIIALPDDLAVGADYGLAVIRGATAGGGSLCRFHRLAAGRGDPGRLRIFAGNGTYSEQSAMSLSRRTLRDATASAALLAPRLARARNRHRRCRRAVAVPAKVRRVFAAGQPAAILLYTLAPDLLLGWPRANRPEAMRLSAARYLRAARGRRPHRARQRHQPRKRRRAQARSHRRCRLDRATSVALAEKVASSKPAFPTRCSTAASCSLVHELREARQADRPRGRRPRFRRLLQHDARRHHQSPCLRAGGKTPARLLRARAARLTTGLGGAIDVETIELLARNVAGESKAG